MGSGPTEDKLELIIGQDKNGNGRDDSLDTLEAHPEHRQSRAEFPKLYHPLADPLHVILDDDALSALELAALTGTAATWAALVEKLVIAVGRSAAVITAAETALVAEGITAAEIAALIAEAEGVAAAAAALAEATAIVAADAELMVSAEAVGLTAEGLVAGVGATAAADAGAVVLAPLLVVAAVVAVVLATIWVLHEIGVFCEPRLATLDGLAYQLQSVGEFRLLEVPGTSVEAQVRFVPVTDSASVTGAVAVSLNGTPVEMHGDGTVLVDGEVQPSGQKWFDFGDGAALLRNGKKFLAVFPGGISMTFQTRTVSFRVPAGVTTQGLLGNNDGIPENDLVTASGEQVTGASTSVIHGRFADSWRVTDESSLFAYEEDQSTEDFTDLAHPANVLTLADYTDAELRAAAEVCTDKGVVEGPQFEDCMLDVALTGDESYAADAAAVTQFLQDPNAREIDPAGVLSEDYEAAIPVNLKPISTMSVPTDTGIGTAAGPIFDNSGYTFTVPDLPPHSDARVSFDLYTFGLEDTEDGTAELSVDGLPGSVLDLTATGGSVNSGPAQITELGSGTATPGGAYRKYRVTVAGEHLASQLRATIMPTGFRGLLDTSIAVDNLDIIITVVPPQVFTIDRDADVSPDNPGTGAGTLETNAAHDHYVFTIADGDPDAEYLTFSTCPSKTRWELRTADGVVRTRGTCSTAELAGLSPDTYVLDVYPTTTAAMPASYAFTLRAKPADIDAGGLAVDGPPVAITMTDPGQNATATFAGTGGRMRVSVPTSTISSAYLVVTITAPDGTEAVSPSYAGQGKVFVLESTQTGTYQVRLNPRDTHTGTTSIQVETAA